MRPRNHLLYLAALIAIGALLYLPSFQIPFLWDDKFLIIEDRFLRSWRFLPDLFGAAFYSEVFHQSYYRPLQGVSFLIDYQLWGLSPAGFHLTSLAIHLTNGALVYALAWALTARRLPAFVAGLIFLVHPVQVQAVGYISGRADPMATLGVLTSVLAWLRFRESAPRAGFLWYLGALAGMAFAWLSKEGSLVLPLILIWIDGVGISGRGRLTFTARWLPFLPIALAFLIYLGLRQTLGFGGPQPPLELISRLLTIPKMLVTYLRIFLLPIDLHMERRIPWVTSWFDGAAWLSTALLAGVCWLLWRFRKDRVLLFGAGWFFLTWLPVSGLFVLLDPNMADHWLYLPSVGLCLLTAWAKADLADRWPGWRGWIGLEVGLWILFLSGVTLSRIWVWQDPVRVYQDALRWPPPSARVYSNLGNLQLVRGEIDQALKSYQKALAIQPDYAEALSNLGSAYERMGQEALAREQFVRALEMDPSFTTAAFNLIALDLRAGRLNEAKIRLRSVKPRFPKEEVRWATIDVELALRGGRLEEAQEKIHLTLKVHPREPQLLNLQGILLRRQGRLKEAAAVFKDLVALAPHEATPWVNLGNVYRDLGERQEAIHCYRKALELDASHPEAKANLGDAP